MILRRLAQNLKDQNWIAISIEFVLLVCGVFLGIQADVDLAQLESDPGLETALNTFASASHAQVLNARLQQGKAEAVIALLDAYARRAGGAQP